MFELQTEHTTHTHTHTHTHAHMQSHTDTHSHAHTHTHTPTPTHPHTCKLGKLSQQVGAVGHDDKHGGLQQRVLPKFGELH